jgi:protein SCO1/2
MVFFASIHDKSSHIVHYLLLLILFALVTVLPAQVVRENVPELKAINVQEHLGAQIDTSLTFTDEEGNRVTLADYFRDGRPVMLTLAYYNCPMLCTLVLNAVSDGIDQLPWQPGQEYQVITVSINPLETPELAAQKKQNYLSAMEKKINPDGWHFLVGEQEAISRLAEQVGFVYYYDEEKEQYAHPAVTYLLTPEGVISRYLYGLDYTGLNLKLALLEAGQGKLGNTIDQLLLYCYHYDPDEKGYVVFAGNIMRLGGVMTIFLLGGMLLILWRREAQRNKINLV